MVAYELRSLVSFDRKAFAEYPLDWFTPRDWETYECWWMLLDDRKIGCSAFQAGIDFQQDLGAPDRPRAGTLYIASTAIHPAFRRNGFGGLLKCWQISYARRRGFSRIVTNTRQSNRAMIALNTKFGFRKLRTTRNYYQQPREATVVMELVLPIDPRSSRRAPAPSGPSSA